ncbi:MAG: leucine-rich repeat domain-containing protein [Bacteroidales bacterium]|nr:leucine-rich repeat domain-containing protein [Bacteroidales bacterium]
MKKSIIILVLMTLAISTFAQNFHFSAVCESGQTLYYRILSEENHEVAVTIPCNSPSGWWGYTKPEGDLIIPESVEHGNITYMVTVIDEGAFSYCIGIKSVIVPNSVTTIGKMAFSDISALLDFSLPNSVTNMGDYVFDGTAHIMNDVYNDKIFAYHPRYDQLPYEIPEGVEEIASGAFYGCSLINVDIPNSVQRIGKGAFMYSDLVSAIIPEGVTTIEEDAFSFSRIQTITLPYSVTHIKQAAFLGCSRMDSILLPNSLQTIGKEAFRSCERLQTIVIPNSVTNIGESAFSNCASLTSVELPNSVTNMGGRVFEGCGGLTEPVYNSHFFAYYPCDYASSYHIPDSVEIILSRAFWNCIHLDSVIFSNTVKTIKYQAFLHCDSLTYVSLPESLETIEEDAFRECSLITTINLPNSLTYIGDGAFSDCQNLSEPLYNDHYFAHFPKNYATNYTIPEGIQEVCNAAFNGCDSLVSVSFPNSVTRIRYYAIYNCPHLLKINIYSETPPVINLNALYPWYVRPADAYIYVPLGTLETYLNDKNWCDYFWCLAEMGNLLGGREMYYEILNDDGSITYQHLECVGDTLINRAGKRPKVIVRSNTHYDRNQITEVTHEYIYEENGKVYWWNKTTEEFTTLYDFTANVGDEWDIKVGNETVTVHVDATDENYVYNNTNYRMLYITDANEIFSGTIICGIGHLTSFFPEKLMTQSKSFRVEGLRCYWRNGFLELKYGEKDCNEVYHQYHSGIDEPVDNGFTIYPNPATGVLFVRLPQCDSPTATKNEYRITNLTGQTLQKGVINTETQQINIEKLSAGMYFISVGEQTVKFVVR